MGISGDALPTRAINRTPGQPDEPVSQAKIREQRWDRDRDAYKRLKKSGVNPPSIDGAALRERQGNTKYDIEARKVTIDYSDPN